MKAVVQMVIQQSGWLICFLLFFALLNGVFVCEGLWQGTGLHGYTLQPGSKGGPPHMVSTWTAFIEMLTFVGLAVPFGLIALRKNGVRLRLGNAGVVENSGREIVLRTKRRQKR